MEAALLGGVAVGQTGLNAHGSRLADRQRASAPGLGSAVPHTP